MSENENSNDMHNIKDDWYSSPVDSKIYLIFICLEIILLFYSILEMKPIMVNIEDQFGLVSHLTLAYWVGLVLTIVCSIKLYLDSEIKKDRLYLAQLIMIGLFLFGLPLFAEENARFAWSYYPAGEVKYILEEGTIGNINEHELGTYRSWPATHFVSASVITLADIKIEDLIKYMPGYWALSVMLITYSIGKLFKLQANECFIASVFLISSFWTINYYYGPQSMAYILYLLFFASMILIYTINNEINSDGMNNDHINNDKIDRRLNRKIFITLTYAAMVTMHMLTALVLIVSSILSSKFVRSLYNDKMKLIILFIIIFVGWHMYVATMMFDTGIKEVVKQIHEFKFFSTFTSEKYDVGNTLIREVIHYSRLGYLAAYGISVTMAVILYLKGITNKNRELIKICLLWFIGMLSFVAFQYGPEIDDRVFILSLLPMAYIIIMTYGRRVIILLMILFIVLHIPAHYGTESYDMIHTADLQGSKYLAGIINPEDYVNYYFAPLIRFYNPLFSNSTGFDGFGYYNPNNVSIEDSTYIISSRELHNYLIYNYGVDKLLLWSQEENASTLLYDNGYYDIYRRID